MTCLPRRCRSSNAPPKTMWPKEDASPQVQQDAGERARNTWPEGHLTVEWRCCFPAMSLSSLSLVVVLIIDICDLQMEHDVASVPPQNTARDRRLAPHKLWQKRSLKEALAPLSDWARTKVTTTSEGASSALFRAARASNYGT